MGLECSISVASGTGISTCSGSIDIGSSNAESNGVSGGMALSMGAVSNGNDVSLRAHVLVLRALEDRSKLQDRYNDIMLVKITNFSLTYKSKLFN